MKKYISIFCIIITFFIIYFLQSNFFTWFNIAGVMPNIYVIFVLSIGLFAKRKLGIVFGIIFGLYLDITLGKTVGITSLVLGAVGLAGEILSKNFSKDSRITIMIMVIVITVSYETVLYVINILRDGLEAEILSFAKILLIESLFNVLIVIILYPLMKKLGYHLENVYENKVMLTRFF